MVPRRSPDANLTTDTTSTELQKNHIATKVYVDYSKRSKTIGENKVEIRSATSKDPIPYLPRSSYTNPSSNPHERLLAELHEHELVVLLRPHEKHDIQTASPSQPDHHIQQNAFPNKQRLHQIIVL